MMLRRYQRTWALMLLLALSLTVCVPGYAQGADEVRAQDDFYSYVNTAWFEASEIRADRSSVSSFSEANDVVRERLMADFDAMLSSEKAVVDPLIEKFLQYYALVKDADKLNSDGFAPAAADYARIEALDSLEALTAQAEDWIMDGMPLPFGFYVDQDMADVTAYALNAGRASAYLASPDFYDMENPIGQIVIPLLKQMQTALFVAAGLSEEDAALEVEKAFAFDALLVALTPSLEEQNDTSRYYNPVDFEQFSACSEYIDLGALAQALIGTAPEMVNITDVAFFEVFDTVYAPENFDTMKSWMKLQFLMSRSQLLGDELSEPMLIFNMLLSGASEMPDRGEADYDRAYAMFDDVIGRYYGQTYFGEQARQDVAGIVENAIDVYRRRLEDNDWLGEETKAMAIKKLDAMTIRVGYPDEVDEIYGQLVITPADEGGTLYGNTLAANRLATEASFARYGSVPDRTKWITTGDTVNAFYYPLDNSINFPAGILQAPFYDKDQSESANLGGIGIVIGHEISHAFDLNGASFDEVGNMRDWWTEADYAEFESRADAMVALFDGLPFAGQEISGLLTMNENIADAGGISCMLDIVNTLPDVSLQAFFEAYAAVWRNETTPEAMALLVADEHAPSIFRVNIQCGNCEAFYEAYGVEEGDAMYIAPEARVSIW